MEEDWQNKEPKYMDTRKRWAKYILKEEWKAAIIAAGMDCEGFSLFKQATFRKYNEQVVQIINPDMQQSKKAKNKAGDAFYATVVHGTLKDREDAMHRMAEDVNKQQESPGPARRHTSR